MNIDTNSWHYKFIANSPFHPNTNFCKYFWQTPAILAIYLIMLMVCIVVPIFIISPWLSLVVAWYSGDPVLWLFDEAIAIISLIVQGSVTFALLIMYAVEKFKEWRYNLPPSKFKPPGLIKMRYTAWKEKYCPELKFIYHD